jgi:plasmid stabilization system protein ParE
VTSYVFGELAHQDIDDAAMYYQKQRRGLGDDFADAFEAARDEILQRPQLGNYYKGDVRWRGIPSFPYKIVFYYEPERDRVVITGVLHDRAGPQAWADRASSS